MTTQSNSTYKRPMSVVAVAVVMLLSVGVARAMNVCQALTLYGNATVTGLCKSISMNNLWVCELTAAQPDVHLTFNAQTVLHLTVRTQQKACDQNTNILGNFPGAMNALPAHQVLCGVNVDNYIARLNAVPQLAVGTNNQATLCRTAIQQALNNLKITQPIYNFYIGQCQANNCP